MERLLRASHRFISFTAQPRCAFCLRWSRRWPPPRSRVLCREYLPGRFPDLTLVRSNAGTQKLINTCRASTPKTCQPTVLWDLVRCEIIRITTVEGSLVAFAAWETFEDSYYLWELQVHPDFQGRNIGSALLRECGALGAETQSTCTSTWNLAARGQAITFYLNRGFQVCAVHEVRVFWK
jgi:ribosomal protein S18 acetylase RimI-like enzyme